MNDWEPPVPSLAALEDLADSIRDKEAKLRGLLLERRDLIDTLLAERYRKVDIAKGIGISQGRLEQILANGKPKVGTSEV